MKRKYNVEGNSSRVIEAESNQYYCVSVAIRFAVVLKASYFRFKADIFHPDSKTN